MKISWDSRARAVYVSNLPHEGLGINDHSAMISDNLYLDYNKEGEIIGIEILNASLPVVEEIGNHRQRHGRKAEGCSRA